MARTPDEPDIIPPPIITLLTDFGAADVFVGSMKGVILGINPHAKIIDLTHDIPAHNIRAGAYLLHSASRHFPPGTIHVAVVDPGVGSERRPLLVTTRSYHFLAPDNGLLSYILASEPKAEVRELTAKQYFLGTVGSTFHGRDLFAPAAAWLSLEEPTDAYGPDCRSWVRRRRSAPPATATRPPARRGRGHGTSSRPCPGSTAWPSARGPRPSVPKRGCS